MNAQSAYASAGVDIDQGERAVELMKQWVQATRRPEVIGGIGGFAGLFDASQLARYRHPVLATSTDGVGTKVALARAMDKHDTIGFDLIGMLVDDLVVVGAEPLFVTDYIACGKVVPQRIADIVKGISAACQVAGAALLGGETAEHPGLMGLDDYDLAGATTGVVERDQLIDGSAIAPDDVVLAIASSGLHSNGYSLVREVFLNQQRWSLDRVVPEFGRTLGEELLEPTRVYAKDILALIKAVEVHGLSHITGGGLANNLVRVLPDGVIARVERDTWQPGEVFTLTQVLGGISQSDIEATLNMGVGMVAVLPPDQADQAIQLLRSKGLSSWVAGTIQPGVGAPEVNLVGSYRC